MTKTGAISQREARTLRKEVRELRQLEDTRRNAWADEWPGGVHLGSMKRGNGDGPFEAMVNRIETARKLQHAVVVTTTNNELNFYALPIAAVKGDQ